MRWSQLACVALCLAALAGPGCRRARPLTENDLLAAAPPLDTSWPVDLAAIPRVLVREPAYRTRAPKYALLALGPRAEARVWLVWDGDVLYVDRNGDGDLTEPGKRVTAKPPEDDEDPWTTFPAGDLSVGGKTHRGLRVSFKSVGEDARAFQVDLSTAFAELRGPAEEGGLIFQTAGWQDGDELLQFADRPADAPVLHFGGPLQVRLARWARVVESDPDEPFRQEVNRLLPARMRRHPLPPGFCGNKQIAAHVGTPGLGPATFAIINLSQALHGPRGYPRADVLFAPDPPGGGPVPATFELQGKT